MTINQLPTNVKQGIHTFNRGEFFAAHEYFEDAWRETPDDSREFYRALLHISAGFFRLTQDRTGAALKFFNRAKHWLSFFAIIHMGLDVDKLRTHLDQLIDEIESGKTGKDILEHHSFQIDWESQGKRT